MFVAPRTLACALLLACVTMPLGAQSYYTSEPAQRMGAFGGALAVGDGEVLVGEPANSLRPGLVYVYRKRGTTWQEAAIIAAPDSQVADGFGMSLALDGTTLYVGGGARGTVEVYRKQSGGAWRHSATIRPDSGFTRRDGFAATLAATGEWLLVGAPGVDQRKGRVFVFRRGGNGQWTQHSTLTLGDAATGDVFGAAIDVAGSHAVIGAPGRAERAGAAYVFELDGAAGWREAGQLQTQGLQRADAFGGAVSMMNDRVVVGAPGQSGGQGAAYVFRRDTAGWSQETRLVAFDAAARGRFGSALALDDAELWAGSPGSAPMGRVYTFSRAPATSVAQTVSQAVAPRTGKPRWGFGSTVALRGNLAAVAALGADHGAGVVVIYEKENGQWRERGPVASPPEALPQLIGQERKCSEAGKVALFDCGNVELMAFLPVSAITIDGRGVELNDIWGWTDPQTGKEYALVGRIDGTSFVDISNPSNPVFLGDLPMTEGARAASWRDIKVYKDHAFIVADASGAHGMQVFDLTQLRNVRNAPVRFEPTTTYRRINSAHNVVINEESGYAYSVGSSGGGETCGGGLHMIDIRDPKNPTFAGCFADAQTGRSNTGYSHDAQCVTYKGPDARYRGREICLGSNETALSIADVTDKQSPKAISRASYPNVAYTHQGWLTDDHRFFYMNDEGDESAGSVERTRTLVWDLADLEDPKLIREHLGTQQSIDHNLYVKGNLMYQSNYTSGLRVLDISDPTTPREVGWFDTAPFAPNTPSFQGSWSNYPYFRSGTIAVSSIGEGLFLVKVRDGKVVF